MKVTTSPMYATAPPMSMVQSVSGMPLNTFNGERKVLALHLCTFTALLMARPMFAMLAATMPTSTPHCTPLPTAPSPISKRRLSRTVWSPRTLTLVVVSCGGVPEQATPKEAPAAISPMADTKPATPAEQMASTLRLKAQSEAAKASLAARLPTQAPRMAPFTWQANSDSPSRGAGQVRMMALMSSPIPTTETNASKMLKEHSAIPASSAFCLWRNPFTLWWS